MKKILFLFFLIYSAGLFPFKIGIVGWTNNAVSFEDNQCGSYLKRHLEPLGHIVESIWEDADFDEYEVIVSYNWKPFLKKHKDSVIILCFEPEVIIPENGNFDELRKYYCVFTWNHKICTHPNFEKFYYPCGHNTKINCSLMLPFKERKLACMVNSYLFRWHRQELYSIRRKIVKFYNNYCPEDFSLYAKRGWKWHGYSVFKGFAENKDSILKSHRFNYCLENWDNDYQYISEKIFDSFNNLCVPIYLGSSNICDYIPRAAFIDVRNFKNIRALHKYIETMDEQTYNTYIQAIIKFNQSEIVKKFTFEYLNSCILEKVLQRL